MNGRLYLDHNADAAVSPAALAAYQEAAADFGNPSSRHHAGQAALARLERARATVAQALNAEPHEIVFTSGGTESDALAVLGVAKRSARPHVVTSAIEHAAVSRTLAALARGGDITLTVIAAGRDGRVDPAELLSALADPTRLVSLVLACNETGVVQSVAQVAAACRTRGVVVHTDAVQAVGRIPVDVRALGVDLLSLSGHKLGAVPGIGALYVRHGVELLPLLVGGGHEHGRRASSENVAGAASLAAALLAMPDAAAQAAWAQRRDRLERELALRIDGVDVVGASAPRVCNTSCVRFAGCPGDAIMMALDLDGIAVSTGSACSSGSVEPSPILLGSKYAPHEAAETVRYSLGPGLSDAEIDRVAHATAQVVARIRAS